jgi:predicted phage tail protein
MIRTIKLYGELADSTEVNELELDCDTPRAMLNGLNHVLPGFKEAARKINNLAIVGTAEADGRDPIKTKSLDVAFYDANTIHIFANEVGADAVDGAYALGSYLGTSAFVAGVIIVAAEIALSMAIAYIAQSLAPKPTTPSGTNSSSFIFSGQTDVTSQGGPVQIIYGTCLVTPTIIALDYETLDIPPV